MVPINLSYYSGREEPNQAKESSRTAQFDRTPSYVSKKNRTQSSFLLLGLVALGSIALAGCGGITVAGKSALSSGPALSSLSCASASVTGSGSDACTVTLAAAAPTGGIVVNLASNNAAASVPASVTVPAKATSVGFTTTVTAVSSTQSVTVTASENSTTATFALSLNPAATTTSSALSVNSSTVAFGNVAVGISSTQSVTLQSTGTGAVTVSSAQASGTGFTVTGATFPLTLNSGQSATLSLQFLPTATGAATGSLTISSNATTNSTAVVALSGTGVPLAIDLSWNAPAASSTQIAGYNVYRATGSSSSFQKLNSSVNPPVSYMDSTVVPSTTYQYYVTSVDASGLESTPSNTATVVVP